MASSTAIAGRCQMVPNTSTGPRPDHDGGRPAGAGTRPADHSCNRARSHDPVTGCIACGKRRQFRRMRIRVGGHSCPTLRWLRRKRFQSIGRWSGIDERGACGC